MYIVNYIIADDHQIFRQGLKMVLKDDVLLHFVGEANNGTELLKLLAQKPADVVLLDLKMPEMDGIEATKAIRNLYPDLKIIILTMHSDEHFILHLMELGANGYLLKNADAEEIKRAIHAVHENNYYFNELVSTTMLRKIAFHKNTELKFKPEPQLTEKELQVLKLICDENTTTEIGEKIFLSPRTVEGIRATLLEKIGVRNIAGLVLYAVRHGIV